MREIEESQKYDSESADAVSKHPIAILARASQKIYRCDPRENIVTIHTLPTRKAYISGGPIGFVAKKNHLAPCPGRRSKPIRPLSSTLNATLTYLVPGHRAIAASSATLFPATPRPRDLIVGMRRLPLLPSASIPHQIRRALLPYRSSPYLPLDARWATGLEIERLFSSGPAALADYHQPGEGHRHGPPSGAPADPFDESAAAALPKLPYRFETGIALFAKRAPRPFPPPFLSPPSGSFSDPLSTHHRSRDRRAFVNGELIQGWTNGDDAVFESDHLICANDGVGAWSARPRGHAGCALSS